MAVRTTDALPLAMTDALPIPTLLLPREFPRVPPLRDPLHADTSVALAYPTLASTFPILPQYIDDLPRAEVIDTRAKRACFCFPLMKPSLFQQRSSNLLASAKHVTGSLQG